MEPTTTEPTEPAVPSPIEVLGMIAEKIKSSRDDVRKKLIALRVDRELDVRVDLLDKAFAKRAEADKALKKVNRPDVEHNDGDGNPVPGVYTKARTKEIKDAKDKLAKIEKAITSALTEDNFGKLKELK